MTSYPIDEEHIPIVPLWPDSVPGSEDWTWQEQDSFLPTGERVIRNVSRPSLSCYFPEPSAASGAAVIICPGGAFHFLSIDFEGTDVARWLSSHGIAAFVLKYRLLHTTDAFMDEVSACLSDRDRLAALMQPFYPLLTADIQQALRLVRSNASWFAVNPHAVGVLGFSAGAVVAALSAMHHDAETRPDFVAPIYCGPLPDDSFPADAPPLFMLMADDDAMATANSKRLYDMYHAAHLAVEMHIYDRGGHGFGMKKQNLPADAWIERFCEWLYSLQLVS